MKNIKAGDIIRKGDYYYEVTMPGKNLTSCRRLDKPGVLSINTSDLHTVTIYDTENEKNIIRNRIREQKLKKQGINIEEFAEKTENEKRSILENKKDLSEFEKIDLLKIDYTEKQKQIKTTMPDAVKDWISGSTGLLRCKNNMIKMDLQFQETIDTIKNCCFCKSIEGTMISGKNGFYAHKECVEKARANL